MVAETGLRSLASLFSSVRLLNIFRTNHLPVKMFRYFQEYQRSEHTLWTKMDPELKKETDPVVEPFNEIEFRIETDPHCQDLFLDPDTMDILDPNNGSVPRPSIKKTAQFSYNPDSKFRLEKYQPIADNSRAHDFSNSSKINKDKHL